VKQALSSLVRVNTFAALLALAAVATFPACGPEPRTQCGVVDLRTDPLNCGACGNACGDLEDCLDSNCVASRCVPGTVEECYTGPSGTEGVGTCVGGTRVCLGDETWGACTGEVTPRAEVCINGLDENCSGQADENLDRDGDGFLTCDGDCCDGDQCPDPELVNPGAFESPGNEIDDDCDGIIDNADIVCDQTLVSNSGDAMNYARAIDLCETSTSASRRWGVTSAKLSLTSGNLWPNEKSRAIRRNFGINNPPRAGESLAMISTGHAADVDDTSPPYSTFRGTDMETFSLFPDDFIDAHGGTLPNAAGCPAPFNGLANDVVMLTLKIRTPTNAQSFSMSVNFFSAEYPEYVCTTFNDFFVVLLDSAFVGTPANPTDKNLALYTDADGNQYPVGVNLAFNNTGLFRDCQNGPSSCMIGGTPFDHTACTGATTLVGTGMDDPTIACDANTLVGGGTGWLKISGNVLGGEEITLRIAIWDTSDHLLDSLVLLDNFRWSLDVADPGTDIE
jgi:hypothetical protein